MTARLFRTRRLGTRGRRLRLAALALVWIAPLVAADELDGTWRFTHSRPAPWASAASPAPGWVGSSLLVDGRRVQGPPPLDCGRSRREVIASPFAGLFQGNLPAPADAAARAVGLRTEPVPGWRIDCDTGSFDLHRADPDTLLLAVDGRIWSLSRAPGTAAAPGSPEAAVQRLLEKHFGGDMAFTPLTDLNLADALSSSLRQRIGTYWRQPRAEDDAPPINGDPFTDSQEYPTRFAVQSARIETGRARVAVRFADAQRERELNYLLRRADGTWRLDDIDYGGGRSLTGMLNGG